VSKKLSSPYRSGRVTSWVKLKATDRRPFVIAGYVPSTVAKNAIGALVLGEYVDGKLVPSGHVGSGFSAAVARELWQKLDPLRTKGASLKDETAVAKGAKWVEPVLVAEIEYRSRTGTDIIRHATFRELVEGADPKKIVREACAPAKQTTETAPQVRLTNPGRLLWPEQGITKQGLADFYTEIADWVLPHIVGRPLSLVGMALGTVAFVVSLPFTVPSHSTGQAAKILVGVPTQYTFKRPLGRYITCTEQPDLCK
jgi:bifunctional non-homologous end joining protein LigD